MHTSNCPTSPAAALRGFIAAIVLLFFSSIASAQTVFNILVPGPNGPAHGLFQAQGGNVTAIPTGLETNQFPALSADGRFITISAPDPARPNQLATDLFLFDRVTGTRTQLVDYTAEQQQDGSFVTPHAHYSALSPNNQLVALNTLLMITTNQQGSNNVPMLTVNRASDGFQLSIAEIGQGNALDFFRSEFIGISWAPSGSVFATPAYVNTTTQTGQVHATVGIVLFGFNPGTGQWQRVRQVTQPRIFDNVVPAVIETHILPAFSPNGQRLAFFEMTWPDALLQGPARARLIAVNADGSNFQVLVNFNPGFFPLGLTWSTDGADVIYSIAPQNQVPGGFAPSGDPQGAVIRAVNSTNPTTIRQLPGINAGFFPSQPRVTGPGTVDLSHIQLSLVRLGPGSFRLSAAGLDPLVTYRLESSTDLVTFSNGQNLTGQQIMNGIAIETAEPRKFFRIRNLP